MRRWNLSIAAALVYFCGVNSTSAAELRITFSELADLVQAVMAGATIHLDNKPANLLSMTAGSYLQIAGKQVAIPLPLKSFQLFGSTYAYYVDDLNSESIKVSAVTSGIRLALVFPSKEVYLVGGCVEGGCAVAGSLPKIVWKNGTVSIDVAPVRLGSSVSLRVQSVSIGGTLNARCDSSGDFFSDSACRLGLSSANRTIVKLRPEIASSVKDRVNDAAMQASIASSLKKYLTVGQSSEITITGVSADAKSVKIAFGLSTAGE